MLCPKEKRVKAITEVELYEIDDPAAPYRVVMWCLPPGPPEDVRLGERFPEGSITVPKSSGRSGSTSLHSRAIGSHRRPSPPTPKRSGATPSPSMRPIEGMGSRHRCTKRPAKCFRVP